MKQCHRCGREVHLPAGIQRTDACPICHSDLKCCLNCRFFDPSAANQCREPQIDPVLEKDKANFCEFFQFLQVSPLSQSGANSSQSEKENAKAAFEALFGKKKSQLD
jgi:hypothetical protein